ncbi:MAG: diguanylate cyclase [Rhodocyclales bacterium GT-UBC]|nr:MAG: diguanylate cyclase [Rhodocyclales bacterium GT-UBC]
MLDPNRPSILVVDRSASNRALICDCLRQLPEITPQAAASGLEALRLFDTRPPHLILLDVALQDTDGISLTREIRTRELTMETDSIASWTPIILLSAIQDEDMLARCILAGGDDFLYKPISEIVLLAKVRALLRIAGMQKELHFAHQRLKEISLLDGLTRIPNRRHFDETLTQEWKRCLRQAIPLSIVMGDIDYFKQFNDLYGHQAGDACLQAVAGALNEALYRVEDTVARYGGEEFAAILPNTDITGAMAVAERMRRAARDLGIPHQNGVSGRVSCSFGIASSFPEHGLPPIDLLKAADAGLYLAKRAGRNQVAQAPI